MKGNKILYAGIAILILGIGFAVGTYAYYQTTVSGSVSGTVLAWECTANNQAANFTISLGSLYPGSSGSKDIKISSTIQSGYVITFKTFTNMGANSNHPYLNLYKDSAHSSIINASGTISGTTTLNPTTGRYEGTATFYYWWPYGANGDGTQGVETYNSSAPTVTVTVVCTQQ